MQRRERPAGEWSDVATAMESEITLNGHTRSKEFEYRVIAMNKAGEGESSNSVMAVLCVLRTVFAVGIFGNLTPRGMAK